MKYCSNCGAQLPDDARFCGSCGTACEPAAPVPPVPPAATEASAAQPAQAADGSVRLCEDGVYRWVYELNMFRSTAILGTLLKIFGVIFVGLWLLIGLSGGFDDFGQFSLIMLAVFAGVCVLILISYAIVAAINGGKYCVLFEMNETEIAHIQLPSQFKKAQVAGWIAAFAGVLAGNMTATAAGILGASRNKLVNKFQNVRSIKADPARHIIKVNGALKANQVYVDDTGFDFVLDFLRSHCPNAR